jgi:hypothetical protein
VPVFLRLLEGEQQRWDFVSKQHGVVIHRRTIAPAPRGRNIHCFRGDSSLSRRRVRWSTHSHTHVGAGVGVIRAPPSVVKEYLFEQKVRNTTHDTRHTTHTTHDTLDDTHTMSAAHMA